MNKEGFLAALRAALAGLPREEIDERLAFYAEMIDDRVEEGASEEEAVAGVGTVEEVASQIVAEVPLAKIVKEKITPKRTLKAWEIVLIALGFPLWFPLLVAAGAVMLSLYIVVWAVIISLWAVELSLAVSAVGSVAAAVANFASGTPVAGIAMIGAACVLAGLSIFMFFGRLAASKGILKLTKKTALWVKSLFIGKEKTK